MSGGVVVSEDAQGEVRASRSRAVVDTVRMRALPSTQNRMASLIQQGQVFYRPTTATWFLQPEHGADPMIEAIRGDGRALRTMRATGLIQVDDKASVDSRGAYPVIMTSEGSERYRPR